MPKKHHYKLIVEWTGNTGTGTSNYRSYERSLRVLVENKTDILCTSDTAFKSDKTKHNPECKERFYRSYYVFNFFHVTHY